MERPLILFARGNWAFIKITFVSTSVVGYNFLIDAAKCYFQFRVTPCQIWCSRGFREHEFFYLDAVMCNYKTWYKIPALVHGIGHLIINVNIFLKKSSINNGSHWLSSQSRKLYLWNYLYQRWNVWKPTGLRSAIHTIPGIGNKKAYNAYFHIYDHLNLQFVLYVV